MRISDWSSDVCSSDLHREPDRRHEAADPAVADMIGQRQRTVADARREQLDEQGSERAIDHRREQAEAAEDRDHLALVDLVGVGGGGMRSEEHTSELPSLMRHTYAVFFLKKIIT